MTEREQKLLIALVKMVSQYLDEHGDEVDSISESAGEHALEVLADFGLMEALNTRFGRWTEKGKRFRRDVAGIPDRQAMPATGSRVQLRGVVTRSLEELAPLAAEVAANADLLKRFEDVAFGDDSRRTYEVAQEINAYVRTFYPSLTDHEGLKVQLVLADMIGRRQGKF
ncbi:hypothetical protein FBZ93_11424 [Bradyrhizobium macuxiense]|uniref:Uncharacterized protein n=1 Tax=Bradyrhizobium macuxiense TaxID=1755647 RepID=A0A560L4J8_9BRAD|nr:hypothetical protein [Bradyrhizobium macuxiense]TWB90471.1 hypothetical protein FBZ93_11424 [Bradyrhizobium macuxiense]